MKVTPEKLREEFDRDTYWARIHFVSDEQKESAVLVCASHEYFWDIFKTKDYTEEMLKKWYESVVSKWKNTGEKIFEKPVHYDVYATSQLGIQNGIDFLENEVHP